MPLISNEGKCGLLALQACLPGNLALKRCTGGCRRVWTCWTGMRSPMLDVPSAHSFGGENVRTATAKPGSRTRGSGRCRSIRSGRQCERWVVVGSRYDRAIPWNQTSDENLTGRNFGSAYQYRFERRQSASALPPATNVHLLGNKGGA